MTEPEPLKWHVAFLWLAGYVLTGSLIAAVQPQSGASAWYPPIAIGIALTWRHGVRWLALVLLADFCVALQQYGVNTDAALVAVITSLEVWAGTFLLRRRGVDPGLERMRDFFCLVLASLVATGLGSALGSTMLTLKSGGDFSHFFQAWAPWWLGDATGVIIFLPGLLLCLASATLKTDSPPDAGRRTLMESVAAISLALAPAISQLSVPHAQGILSTGAISVSFLPVFWIAFRFGKVFTSIAVVLIDSAWFVAYLLDQQNGAGQLGSLFELQLLILALGCTGMSLTITLGTERKTRQRLEQAIADVHVSEQRLRDSEMYRRFALDAAKVGDWSLDLATDSARRSLLHDQCFGYTEPVPHWSYQSGLALVHADDRARVDQTFTQALESCGDFDAEYRVIWPDGSLHWLWSRGRFEPGTDGRAVRAAGIVADITKRRLEAEALQRSEMRYDLLVSNSLDGIIQSRPDGAIFAANRAACELFGMDQETLIRKGRAAVIDTSDPRLEVLLRERLKRGAARGELRARKADGSLIDIELSSVLYRDENGELMSSMSLRDITERKFNEKRIQQQVARLELLRETTRAMTTHRDLQSLFSELVTRLCNQMPADIAAVGLYSPSRLAVRLTSLAVSGLDPSVRLALNDDIVVDDNGLSRCLQGLLVYEPDMQGLAFELPRRLVSAGLRSAVLAPLVANGQTFGLILVARRQASGFVSTDCEFLSQLSEHVALAAEQAKLNEDLQQAYSQLQRSQQRAVQQERLHALEEMASGVAHDINNAISPAVLYIESLIDKEKSLSDKSRGMLVSVQSALDGIADTVDRLRHFARDGGSGMALEPVKLNALVMDVMEMTRSRWLDLPHRRGQVIDVSTKLDPGLPDLLANAGELRDALTNLLFNAADALPTGGAIMIKTTKEIDPQGKTWLCLEVADSGVGMDEETLQRCQEPFFSTKGERGTGLGLSVVYGIVQRLQGRIDIQSAPGRGTTVSLKFPSGTREPPKSLMEPQGDSPVGPQCLLVVDDDAHLLEVICDLLRMDGHQVIAAQGGREGLAAMRAALAGTPRIDMVITDLGMPHLDGLQLAKAIKTLSASMPIVMLTGWGRRMSEEHELPDHVDLLISKPPKLAELRAAVRRFARP